MMKNMQCIDNNIQHIYIENVKGGEYMANISLRMDDALKDEFQKLVKNLGMDMSTAFNIFAAQAVREQRIPFEVSMNVPNATTIRAINNVLEGKNMSAGFNTVAELMEDLNKAD